jgi:hypothetical protein
MERYTHRVFQKYILAYSFSNFQNYLMNSEDISKGLDTKRPHKNAFLERCFS